MDATAILDELDRLGVTVELEGPDIICEPGDKIPEHLIPDIREQKQEIVRLLHRGYYRFRFDEGTSLEVEEREVVRQVEDIGIVLLWSSVLNDFIAIYRTMADKIKVPSGFIPYSHAEIEILFAKDLQERSLRHIHAAKRQGTKITSMRKDQTG
jgi:hypothetical protein